MGSTGFSTGPHLHFGVYLGVYSDAASSLSLPRQSQAVDPFGWDGLKFSPQRSDPWGLPSVWLWQANASESKWLNPWELGAWPTEGEFAVADGAVSVRLSAESVQDPSLLELALTLPGRASEVVRQGVAFLWHRLAQSNQEQTLWAMAGTEELTTPATISVQYEDTMVRHLDSGQLALYYYDDARAAWTRLSSSVNALDNTVSCQTAKLGEFSLQAPLLCPAETQEPDDSYYAAEHIGANGVSTRLLDIADDEDWFRFEATAGLEYVIETTSLAAGVTTRLELWDQDALSLLISDDDGGEGGASRIDWVVPASGVYHARVTRAPSSAYGCDAAYTLRITSPDALLHFLPLVVGGR